MVIARKKNGDLRLCIDYCQLNNRTVKDSYALLRLEDILYCFSGARYFHVLSPQDLWACLNGIEGCPMHQELTSR